MKKTLILLISTVLLTNCNYKQTKISNPEKVFVNSDSIKNPKNVNSNKIVTIKRFTGFNNVYFDSLNQVFTNNKFVQTKIVEDVIVVDTEVSYKIMTDTITNSALYLFEWDCGENGDGENQYYLINDSLISNRNFTHYIDEYPTETNEAVLGNKEEIYLFGASTVIIKVRNKLIKGGTGKFDWTKEMSTIPFQTDTTLKEEIYKNIKAKLAGQLDIEELGAE